MSKTYKIVRMYQKDEYSTQVIQTGLTLGQAQAHCRNPETSSRTATSDEAQEWTEKYGAWFDGYEEE